MHPLNPVHLPSAPGARAGSGAEAPGREDTDRERGLRLGPQLGAGEGLGRQTFLSASTSGEHPTVWGPLS